MAQIVKKSAAAKPTVKKAIAAKATGAAKVTKVKTPKEPKPPKEKSQFDLLAEKAAKHPEKLVRDWNERRGGRVRGVTTGLGVEAAWGYILEKNQKAQVKDRLTDKGISQWLKAEFPGKLGREGEPTTVFEVDAIQTTRSKFNRGAFTGGVKPEPQSQPWDGTAWTEVTRGRKAGAPAAQRKPKSDGVPAAKGFGKKVVAPKPKAEPALAGASA